jgi:hypothetical protein
LAEVNFTAGISTLALANRLGRSTLRAIPFADPALDWNIHLIKLKNDRISHEAQQFERMLLQHRDGRIHT